MIYPEGKDFVFTIFDDTDVSTLEYIRPIYDTLTALGMRTTKTVWPLRFDGRSPYGGSHSLENEPYARYIRELQNRGFEIAFHGPTMVSGDRQTVLHSLRIFHDTLGCYPRVYASHAYNQENLYWGEWRLSSPLLRSIYRLISRGRRDYYQGHEEKSKFFWGDVCKEHIDYVRNFTFDEINLLNVSDRIVYRDIATPWVRNWFLTGDADNVEEFNRLLSVDNQKKLLMEKGVCIVSTHLGKGFIKNGEVHPETRRLLELLSKRNGWFVPVSVLLDYLVAQGGVDSLSYRKRLGLECKWMMSLFRRKLNKLNYEKTEVEYLTGK